MVQIERNQKQIKHPPLLYILQPSSTDIQVQMQSEWKRKNVKKPVLDTESVSRIEEPPSVKQKKNFKDFNKWSLTEKVIYFIELPENRKKNICRILTKEKEIVGKIVGYEGGIVDVFLPLSGACKKIPVDDILNIEVIGV
ncbi:spore coat CotO family protein [Bacillus tianshenii]|uniref:CotO family spore coat protein n=1 Tax=Sutcliffiella tianshenii TaxID=1463404 RepID=UPI001CD74ADA|nr:CotO family spore coat protein [Bacillus tianshenii]MCA1320052.1 spore coat CotO family protein [Bacillus tianshenii]